VPYPSDQGLVAVEEVDLNGHPMFLVFVPGFNRLTGIRGQEPGKNSVSWLPALPR
jgi:hypothetical protein